MHITMNIINLPPLHDYWQQKHSFFVVPYFGKVMSPEQYKEIHQYLHFCHEDESIPKNQPGHYSLYKIRGLVNLIIPKFQSLYVPKQHICIDESLVPFKGQISLCQFILSKCTLFGIKAWVPRLDLTTRDLYFTILVDFFTNHILVENIFHKSYRVNRT